MLKYDYSICPSETREKQGKRKEIEKYAKQYGYKITLEKNGYFVLTKPMQVAIFEYKDGELNRAADPRRYFRKNHPEYEKLTQKRVEKLVDDLNNGIVNFDDVIAAEKEN